MENHAPFNGEGAGRLENILLSYLEAVECGHAPERQQLLDAHPELRTELAEFFSAEELIESVASPLRWAVQAILKTPLPTNPHSPKAFAPSCGGHELLEEIGRGGMGVVYRARHKQLNRLVAPKLFRADPLTSRDELQRFRNEAQVIAQLDHPHIVVIYEIGEAEGRLYFSMKWYKGGSLAGQLSRYRSDKRAAARLVGDGGASGASRPSAGHPAPRSQARQCLAR